MTLYKDKRLDSKDENRESLRPEINCVKIRSGQTINHSFSRVSQCRAGSVNLSSVPHVF